MTVRESAPPADILAAARGVVSLDTGRVLAHGHTLGETAVLPAVLP